MTVIAPSLIAGVAMISITSSGVAPLAGVPLAGCAWPE
jgi:hypothetical protein